MEVCGLQWSPDGFLASGSNDNNVAIWKPMESDLPLFILKEHKAAVKVRGNIMVLNVRVNV